MVKKVPLIITQIDSFSKKGILFYFAFTKFGVCNICKRRFPKYILLFETIEQFILFVLIFEIQRAYFL